MDWKLTHTRNKNWKQTLSYSDSVRYIWILALLTYGFMDVVGTFIILQFPRGLESNPIVLSMISEIGLWALPINKIGALAILWLIWKYWPSIGGIGPDPYRLTVPVLMFLNGVRLSIIHAHSLTDLLGF